MEIPPNNQFTQVNDGDLNGILWSTFNCDFTRKKGVVRGTRLITNQSKSSDLANLGLPVGFVKHDTGGGIINAPYFTVAGSRVFKSVSGSVPVAFQQDSATSTPTTCSSACSDLKVFASYLYVTTASNTVYYTDTDVSWSTFTAGSSDTNAHMLCVYGNRMYMTTGQSKIISWDSSRSVASSSTYTLELASAGLGTAIENLITFIKPVSNGIWIGTINQLGRNGRVYFWNGVIANTPQAIYTLESTGALSCVIKDDTPYIIDTNGRLLVFNGGTFREIARFPNKNLKMLNNSLGSTNQRWIHPNGMDIVNNRINILVSLSKFSSSGQNEENAPSGIWEYDQEIGLYHKYSISYLDTAVGTTTDYGQMRIGYSTGDGNESGAGGLSWIQNNSDTASRNGNLLAGFKYYTNSSTTQYGIFFDDNNSFWQTYSSFITQKIPASQLKDNWNKIYVLHKPFLDTSDKIVVKYRTTYLAPTEATITWASTTGFTTTTSLSSYSVGDEVEILQGLGGGKCAHITALTVNDSGYSVELDETFTGATGTSIARFQKWKKAGVINDTFDFSSVNMTVSSTYIQLKFCLQFTGEDEFIRARLINTPNQLLV